MKDPRIYELEWYKIYGKYPERIKRDSKGQEYVIGDWSWERNYPNKPEWIDYKMRLREEK